MRRLFSLFLIFFFSLSLVNSAYVSVANYSEEDLKKMDDYDLQDIEELQCQNYFLKHWPGSDINRSIITPNSFAGKGITYSLVFSSQSNYYLINKYIQRDKNFSPSKVKKLLWKLEGGGTDRDEYVYNTYKTNIENLSNKLIYIKPSDLDIFIESYKAFPFDIWDLSEADKYFYDKYGKIKVNTVLSTSMGVCFLKNVDLEKQKIYLTYLWKVPTSLADRVRMPYIEKYLTLDKINWSRLWNIPKGKVVLYSGSVGVIEKEINGEAQYGYLIFTVDEEFHKILEKYNYKWIKYHNPSVLNDYKIGRKFYGYTFRSMSMSLDDLIKFVELGGVVYIPGYKITSWEQLKKLNPFNDTDKEKYMYDRDKLLSEYLGCDIVKVHYDFNKCKCYDIVVLYNKTTFEKVKEFCAKNEDEFNKLINKYKDKYYVANVNSPDTLIFKVPATNKTVFLFGTIPDIGEIFDYLYEHGYREFISYEPDKPEGKGDVYTIPKTGTLNVTDKVYYNSINRYKDRIKILNETYYIFDIRGWKGKVANQPLYELVKENDYSEHMFLAKRVDYEIDYSNLKEFKLHLPCQIIVAPARLLYALDSSQIMKISYFDYYRLSNFDPLIAYTQTQRDGQSLEFGFLGKLVWQPDYSIIGAGFDTRIPRFWVSYYAPYGAQESIPKRGETFLSAFQGIISGIGSKFSKDLAKMMYEVSRNIMDHQPPLFTDGDAYLFRFVLEDIYGSPYKDLLVFGNTNANDLIHFFNKERGEIIYPEGKDLLTQYHPVILFRNPKMSRGYSIGWIEQKMKKGELWEKISEHPQARNTILGTGLGIIAGVAIASFFGVSMAPAVAIAGGIGLLLGLLF